MKGSYINRELTVSSTTRMKLLATKYAAATGRAIRSRIFQREVLIIISVITRRLLFIGELRDNNTSLRQIYGRVIITQIDRLRHENAATVNSRALPTANLNF